MSSTVIAKNIQIGADGTASNNFTIFQPASPDGTLRIGNGNTGITASLVALTSAGNVGIGTSAPGVSRLNVQGTQSATLGTTAQFTLSSGQGFYLNSETGNINRIAVGTGEAMAFNIGSTEQARITSAGLFQFNSGYGSVATAYGCRAWVNFNGTGTVAIRASGNVSSITDNGTGTFRINFATSMPDSNYAAVGTAVNSSSYVVGITSASNNQADYIDIRVTTDAGSLNDPNFCYYAFFR